MDAETLLPISLELAVTLWIDRVRGYSEEERFARARECVDVIASKGDDILYRSQKAGGTADAFNALAEGLACAAFQPGGVTFMGCHFEAT